MNLQASLNDLAIEPQGGQLDSLQAAVLSKIKHTLTLHPIPSLLGVQSKTFSLVSGVLVTPRPLNIVV